MERSGALPRSLYWEAEERELDPGLARHSLQPSTACREPCPPPAGAACPCLLPEGWPSGSPKATALFPDGKRNGAGAVGRQLGGGQRDSGARSDDSARTQPGPKDGFSSARGHVTSCSGRAGRLCRNSILSRSRTGHRGAADGTTLALSHRLGNLGEAEEEEQAGWEPRAQRLSFSSVKWSNSLFPVPRCRGRPREIVEEEVFWKLTHSLKHFGRKPVTG